MSYPFRFINRVIASTAVSADTEAVTYTFPNNSFANTWARGLVLVNLEQAIPAGTTGTLPVRLQVNGSTEPLTLPGGAAVTAADITGAGVYLVYYDKTRNLLQIVNGL